MDWLLTGDGLIYLRKEPTVEAHTKMVREGEKTYSAGGDTIVYPVALKPILDAVAEVMLSNDEDTKLALFQNAFAFQKAVRNDAKINRLEQDMEVIKRRFLSQDTAREDDFKTQEATGEKHRAGGD